MKMHRKTLRIIASIGVFACGSLLDSKLLMLIAVVYLLLEIMEVIR